MDFSLAMFIEISDDITAILHSPDCCNYEKIVHFMHEVAICMKRGKHYVYIPSLRNGALKNRIKEIMPGIAKILYQADAAEVKSLEKKLEWKMLVTRNIPEVKQLNILYYNPLQNKAFELYKETHLICENLYDCDFYEAVAQAYCNHYKLRPNSFLFFPRNGGGTTTASVIKKEMEKGNHLCLIICDSDRHYPDGPVGDTMKEINEIFKDNKSNYFYLLKLENVGEIENLIPLQFLRDDLHKYKPSPKNLSDAFLNQCDTSFFDFKKGLGYKELYSAEAYAHWKPILDKLSIDSSKREDFLRKSPHDRGGYEKLCENEPKLISSWGSSILAATVVGLRKDLRKFNLDKLSASQKFYWDEIGKLIYNWCLSRRLS